MEKQEKSLAMSSNQLKILALIAMTADHVGLMLLPGCQILRIIGRLAFPIFAYMIAEGCRYTSHKARYLGMVLGIGILCQLVYFFTMRSVYQCILITFAMSISIIFILQWARQKDGLRWLGFLAVCLASVFLCLILPQLLKGTDYCIDYGLTGVMLPVLIYLADTRPCRLLAAGIGLILVALEAGGIQWFGLLALLPLALYDGARGKLRLKYLFYIYYPLHLAVIWAVGMLLNRM